MFPKKLVGNFVSATFLQKTFEKHIFLFSKNFQEHFSYSSNVGKHASLVQCVRHPVKSPAAINVSPITLVESFDQSYRKHGTEELLIRGVQLHTTHCRIYHLSLLMAYHCNKNLLLRSDCILKGLMGYQCHIDLGKCIERQNKQMAFEFLPIYNLQT